MCIGLHVNYPLFFSDFIETNFLDIVLKNTKIPNFMKIRLAGAGLFQSDGRADMTKVLVVFFSRFRTLLKLHILLIKCIFVFRLILGVNSRFAEENKCMFVIDTLNILRDV